ncbi:flavodoxin family protein [Streptomyces aidingensis]|uniref:Multimeric flavodoxin WrbA n=1 Tax=Streptomyces aidingensis TaxID=910347 RepID=A0A1I1FFD7_9ACTN|nr:flavodoxin family protein [Streptomyces aidingensis]SFB98065.1 Multimeric flavodoxin WrbA [Streptomyces aidingensis]
MSTRTDGPRVVIAYHSGYGHTTALAEAVLAGATEAGARADAVQVDTLGEAGDDRWALLDGADAIVFGSPTYMGSASAAFHAFAEATSGRWAERAWSGKLAAGFTMSGAKSGDKLNTLQYFTLLAAQHGMLWVNLDLMPGWNASTGSENDLNRLGFYLGAGGQANVDEGPETVTKADLETARHLGRHVTRTARRVSPAT